MHRMAYLVEKLANCFYLLRFATQEKTVFSVASMSWVGVTLLCARFELQVRGCQFVHQVCHSLHW